MFVVQVDDVEDSATVAGLFEPHLPDGLYYTLDNIFMQDSNFMIAQSMLTLFSSEYMLQIEDTNIKSAFFFQTPEKIFLPKIELYSEGLACAKSCLV